MKKIIVSLSVFAAFLLLPFFASAQAGGTIKGKLINSSNGEPVLFANVYVKYGDQLIGTMSDENGNYTIKPIPPGTYTVYATAIGWNEVSLLDVKVFDETITFADEISLTEGVNLPPVFISSEKIIDPGAPNTVKMIAKETKNLPNNTSISGLVKVMTSEVLVNEERDEIYFRGSRNGDAIYYIDGIRISDPSQTCPSMAIGSIMVYTGGVPAKYGDFSGGVVVIETMSYFDWQAQKESERLRNGGN